ncbi:hypothetical protein BDY24DRAFT_392985 [Mrakia frigida]|uniref:uncharacterized protein n=1 Tax=Mrakia frigida TaxID=29902 RepID=UPI003FCC0D3E
MFSLLSMRCVFFALHEMTLQLLALHPSPENPLSFPSLPLVVPFPLQTTSLSLSDPLKSQRRPTMFLKSTLRTLNNRSPTFTRLIPPLVVSSSSAPFPFPLTH